MKMNEQALAPKILATLKSDNSSYLHKLLNFDVPQNDQEYMQFYRLYFSTYLCEDLKPDILSDKYIAYLTDPYKIEGLRDVKSEIQFLANKRLNELRENIGFEPKVIKYINTFPKDDTDNVERLMLYVLTKLEKEYSVLKTNTLERIASAIDIPYLWLLSLHKNHKLFSEGLIWFEQRSSEREEEILDQNLHVCSVLTRFFWGFELNDHDLVNVQKMEIPKLFGYSSGQTSEILNNNPDQSALSDSKNYQTIEELYEEHKPDPQNRYSDSKYMEMESKWIVSLFKLKEKQNNTISLIKDSEIDVLRNKISRQKRESAAYLSRASKKGILPFIIKMKRKLKLSEDELNIFKLLAIRENHRLLDIHDLSFSRPFTVNDVLGILYDDLDKKIEARKYFLKSSKLVEPGIIQLISNSYTGDLLNYEVKVDLHYSSWVLGTSFDVQEGGVGSILIEPKLTFDDVITESEVKQEVKTRLLTFEDLEHSRRELEFGPHMKKQNSHFYVITGPSGTGKTSLAEAMANSINKKMLSYNLKQYEHMASLSKESDGIFYTLFREAVNKDAILFFDESEYILQNRMNDLLIHSNNFNVIVIFATNAEFTMDEAMDSRVGINIIQLKYPDAEMRFEILKLHLPLNINLPDVNELKKLANKMRLTGREIKGVVNAAITHAIEEHGHWNIDSIKIEHLNKAVEKFKRPRKYNSKSQRIETPIKGFAAGVFHPDVLTGLQSLVNDYEKTKVLIKDGFIEEDLIQRKVAIFHGPSGTGKTMAAKMVAYETGKNFEVVNASQILDKYVGETEKNIAALFQSVSKTDSILIFDEADSFFSKRTSIDSSVDKFNNRITNLLLQEISKVDTLVILTTNLKENFDLAFDRRVTEIEFKKPSHKLREALWEKCIPAKIRDRSTIDYEFLAGKYPKLTGAEIKNIIVEASFKRCGNKNDDIVLNTDILVHCANRVHSVNQKNGIGFIHN